MTERAATTIVAAVEVRLRAYGAANVLRMICESSLASRFARSM